MSVKLVSLNIGVQLELEVDGKQKLVTWSAVCPSKDNPQPIEIIKALCDFLGDEFTREFVAYDVYNSPVHIAKPSRIKATKQMSHIAFNKRVKKNLEKLGYKP